VGVDKKKSSLTLENFSFQILNKIKMKIKLAFLCSIFIIVIFLSCSKREVKQSIQEIKIDYTNEKGASFLLTEDYFNNRKIVRLETTDESLISQINRLIVFDGKYYIFDHQGKSVFVFDELGKFIAKIKQIGKGPGEYLQITDFTIDTKNKQIILLCDIPNCLMYFDLDCKFLKQEKRENYDHYISANQNSLFFGSFLTNNGHYIKIRNGNKYSEFLPIEKHVITKDFYSSHPNIIRSNSVFFFKVYDNTVYELDSDNIIAKYKMDFGTKAVDKSFIEKNDMETIIMTTCDNDWICRINDFRECDNYLTFGFWPFTRIVIYDKKKKTSIIFSQLYDSEIGLYLNDMIGHDGDGSDMIFIVNPRLFKNNILQIKNMKVAVKNQTYLKYKEVAENLTENDNPILMVYSMK
jgi:hypothetical protein